MGEYDIMLIVQAPDDETAARSARAAVMQGNLRTTVLRAFDGRQMEQALEGLPAAA